MTQGRSNHIRLSHVCGGSVCGLLAVVALLLAGLFWSAPASAAQCPGFSITVPHGGSVTTPHCSAAGFDGFNPVGSIPAGQGPQHGTLTIDDGVTPNTFTYTHDGGGATSDGFTIMDSANQPMSVQVTIQPATSPITISPTTLSMRAGAFFSQQLTASGGTGPYTFSYSGTLPPGILLSPGGLVSGTPTSRELFNFTVTATDSTSAAGLQSYAVDVDSPLLTLSPLSANGAVGVPFSQTFTPGGGIAPYTLALAGGSNPLPAGLSLSGFTISGTPTIQANYTFDLVLTDSSTGAGGGFWESFSVSINVLAVPAPTILTVSPGAGPMAGGNIVTITGTNFSTTAANNIVTFGGTNATVAASSATSLTVTAPSRAAAETVDVAVTVNGQTATATNAYSYLAPVTLTLSPAAGALPAGEVGTSYSQGFTAAGGSGTYSYAMTAGAPPPGLTLAANGTLSGTPSATGTFIFTITATDTVTPANTGAAAYTLQINAAPVTLTLTPAAGALPAGEVGTSYSQSFTAAGGSGSYSYAVTAGALPAGLTLAADGTLSGTPSAVGAASFTITATDTVTPANTGAAAYTLQIDAAPVTLTPADGTALTAGTVGVSYSETAISASGGVGAITFTAIGLPAGLAMNPATGDIAGTPAADGNFTVTVTATAATSGTASASYTVAIAAAPPVLTSVSPAQGPDAGGTGIILTGNHLTGATGLTIGGVAATGITVVSATQIAAVTPAHPAGTTDITVTTPAGTATLPAAFTYIAPTFTFFPASGALPGGTAGLEYVQAVSVTGGSAPYRFSAAGLPEGMSIDPGTGTIRGLPTTPGAHTIVVTVRDGAGLIGSVTYSLSLGGVYRPDPTQDAEVIGLVRAQAQAAQRFATTQIGNFNDRLERLHNDRSRDASSLNVRLGVTQGADSGRPLGYAGQAPAGDTAGRVMGLPQAGSETGAGSAPQPIDARFGDTAFWAGGFVNFGTSDRGAIDLDHTLVGVSGGVDHRFTPDFVAGFGLGYGRDKTDIGSNGTTSTGQAFSAAIYGSYHPRPFYLDGLLGASRLGFDSTRHVTTTGDFATGSRDGTQIFGSLSAGYEHRQDGLLFSPYGRIEAAFTRLDSFTETGAGPYSLTFGSQTFDMLAGVVGVRAEYAIPMDWGVLNTRGRLEYTHDFAGSSQATMGYADLGTLPYPFELDEYMRDYLTVGLGLDARLDTGMTLSFDYRTAFGFDGDAQSHTIGIRVGGTF